MQYLCLRSILAAKKPLSFLEFGKEGLKNEAQTAAASSSQGQHNVRAFRTHSEIAEAIVVAVPVLG